MTGAAGLLGGAVVSRLVQLGAVVRGTVHERKPWRCEPGVDYVTCDLTRPEDCRAVVQDVRYLFHCAANTTGAHVTASTPMVHVTPNVVMNAWLFESAYNAGVEKIVWQGSTTGYPVSGDRPVTEDEMFQGEPYDKYFFVGHMKRFSEVLCRMYGEKLPRRMSMLVLRSSNVYGPGDKFEPHRSHVTAALIKKAVERQDPLEVWGTGDDVRDLIYIDDAVEGMLRAMQRLEGYQALNLASGRGYSVKEILTLILELTGYTEARVRFDPEKPTMIPIRLVDTRKMEELLGFRATVDLREGLRRTIDWYRAHPVAG